MQFLFETSGWALPKNIATQKKDNETKEDNNASKEADQLQEQIKVLNDQPNKKPNNNKKNKKRELEQQQEKSEQNVQKKQKIEQKKKKQNNQQQQQTKKQDNNKQQQKKKQESNNDQQKKQENNNNQQKKQNDDNNKKDQKKKKLQALLAKKNEAIAAEAKKQQQQPQANELSVNKKKKTVVKEVEEKDDGLTPLQRKMKEKLSGARFRWLNEQLYTTPGKKSFDLFQEKPELFDEYHEGFRHQVESWPENPVDIIIDQLRELPETTVIADLGCGDAMIARTLTKHNVLSFDLIAKNELVTACDISKLPLDANSIDVAVFSLSLMGTNYIDFLKEAHRVLKVGGELKIAEVVSRFSHLDTFINLLESLGFDFMDKEDDNKMFVMLYFTKSPSYEDEDAEMLSGLTKTQKRSLMKGAGVNNSNIKLQKKAQQLLKPCLYKKR